MGIQVWCSPKVAVRASVYGGQAVFAIQPIQAGERVAVKAGHIVDTAEVLRLTEEVGDFSLQIDEDLILSPRHLDGYEDLVVHIAHSCEANVGFSGQVTYAAIRDVDVDVDVDVDEELCHDYAMARKSPYSLDCLCGTEACRGTVTHDDWKLPDVQARYSGWFMPYVQRRIYTLA